MKYDIRNDTLPPYFFDEGREEVVEKWMAFGKRSINDNEHMTVIFSTIEIALQKLFADKISKAPWKLQKNNYSI